MRGPARISFRLVAPLRAALGRFAFALLIMASLGLMVSSRFDLFAVDRARGLLLDVVAPFYEAMSRPADTIAGTLADIRGFWQLRTENARLREEVERLERWHEVARKLDAENESLRALLGYPADSEVRSITGRVVADHGGAFVRSVLVTVGSQNGVMRGQPAVTGEGLAGRVTDVGERTARILLVTDLNSRIPVMIESTRERAVLAGDNSSEPRLIYLRQGAVVSPGDRVVTSGHGNTWHAGMPVGVVTSNGDRGVLVQPYVDWSRLEYIRLLDQNLGGILTQPPPSGPSRGRGTR
jgi:rod shape-determining protein MreC